MLCRLKQALDFVESKDVMYSISCRKWNIRYNGETGQYFCQIFFMLVGREIKDMVMVSMPGGRAPCVCLDPIECRG